MRRGGGAWAELSGLLPAPNVLILPVVVEGLLEGLVIGLGAGTPVVELRFLDAAVVCTTTSQLLFLCARSQGSVHECRLCLSYDK